MPEFVKAGAEIADGMTSCMECGDSMLSTKECPQCHAQCSSDMEFCRECGCPLDISDIDISQVDSHSAECQKLQKISIVSLQGESACDSVSEQASPLISQGMPNPQYEENPRWWSWRGRMGRKGYFWFNVVFNLIAPLGFILILFLAAVVAWALNAVLGETVGDAVGVIVLIALVLYIVYVRVGADVRRFHDLGHSGWGLLIFYVGQVVCFCGTVAFLVGRQGVWTFNAVVEMFESTEWMGWLLTILNFLVFNCLKGTEGPNKYGPEPGGYREGTLVARRRMCQLQELNEKKKSGLITEAEYEQQRARIFTMSR